MPSGAQSQADQAPEGPDETDPLAELARQAADLAEALLAQAAALPRSRAQRRQDTLMARLSEDPEAKRFVFHVTDRVLRANDAEVAAQQFRRVITQDRIPAAFPPIERVALRVAAVAAAAAPSLVMALVRARLRQASRSVVLDAAPFRLHRHLQQRQAVGVVSNINVLGEAVLGESEANDRLERVLAQVRDPEVSYVSVKLSAIAANLSVLAFDQTVERLAQRLGRIYQAAAQTQPPTFVNLDMEEYRDLALTVATFRRALGVDPPTDPSTEHANRATGPARHSLEVGIVLQAYLPDSLAALMELTEWAQQRRSDGGGVIKVRLVKGANLAMEGVEAELAGWVPAPYPTKAEVDANYKRLVEWALRPEHTQAVRVGVASHNLFDVCFALLLADRRQIGHHLDIEMLEGMAETQVSIVAQRARRMVLYTPVAARRDFSSAIAYLSRRLEENTAPQNYLAQLHRLAEDRVARADERQRFLYAVRDRNQPPTAARRDQRRPQTPAPEQDDQVFSNAPDTDFAVAANRVWLHRQLADYRSVAAAEPPRSLDEVDAAVARAAASGQPWANTTGDRRRQVLRRVGAVMEAERGQAIAAMVSEGAKVVAEADAEVSEAVDFARYYGEGAVALTKLEGLTHQPRGVVVVVSPWNFPYAIPAGGVLAALAAGNAVILKPAPQTAGLGQFLVNQLHRAGVPKDLVVCLPAPEDERGRRLITHPGVGAVVLTGAADTARLFTDWRPDLVLHAETSGKNAMVVSATADVDLAVGDIVRSAFGHAGQKCSAASLAIVDQRVLKDRTFLRQLRDAVVSLPVGSPHDLAAVMGPLIAPPGPDLYRALTTLEPGESWLVEPQPLADGVAWPTALGWRPGVKIGVRPGSWFHQTECFGPVLGVMAAASLEEATMWQNQVTFGLTGGLHSLDDTEIAWWLDHVEVGNAYVNRPITGAVVGRQPFGGWKRSAVGPGAKAGGPNYVPSLGTWQEGTAGSPPRSNGTAPEPGTSRHPIGRNDLRAALLLLNSEGSNEELWAAAASYEHWWDTHFNVEHDPSALSAERNRFRYRALETACLVRFEADTAPGDQARALLAAVTTGTAVLVSTALRPPAWLRPGRLGLLDVVVESQDELAERLLSGEHEPVARLRVLGPVGKPLWRAARRRWLSLLEDPVVGHGRVELARWLREQTVTETRHRYGNPW